jgi:hypothetical protein
VLRIYCNKWYVYAPRDPRPHELFKLVLAREAWGTGLLEGGEFWGGGLRSDKVQVQAERGNERGRP